MAKIIRAVLPLTYTFTGDDRDASATLENDAVLTLKNASESDGGSYSCLKEGDKIVSAVLSPSGAEGLRSAVGKLAAELTLAVIDGAGNEKSRFVLAFGEWGEKEKKNISLEGIGGGCFSLKMISGSVIRVDDFNVQDSYVGEDVVPVVELEIVSQ